MGQMPSHSWRSEKMKPDQGQSFMILSIDFLFQRKIIHSMDKALVLKE